LIEEQNSEPMQPVQSQEVTESTPTNTVETEPLIVLEEPPKDFLPAAFSVPYKPYTPTEEDTITPHSTAQNAKPYSGVEFNLNPLPEKADKKRRPKRRPKPAKSTTPQQQPQPQQREREVHQNVQGRVIQGYPTNQPADSSMYRTTIPAELNGSFFTPHRVNIGSQRTGPIPLQEMYGYNTQPPVWPIQVTYMRSY
jgi:hypothetical protein